MSIRPTLWFPAPWLIMPKIATSVNFYRIVRVASRPNIDVLMLTALTEEQQVVHAVLQRYSRRLGEYGNPPNQVTLYDFQANNATNYLIACACMHDMGVEAMSAFATALLTSGLRPSVAALVGIAAAAHDDIDLGDVPIASQVYSAGDIQVRDGRLTFRPQGFQVDHRLKMAAGAIREDTDRHKRWRLECRAVIEHVVQALNESGLRPHAMSVPSDLRLPRLVVEVGAGGPFLLKDANFARALREGSATVDYVHPKLSWVDMEAHGFMKAAHAINVSAIVMKGISDRGDAEKGVFEHKTKGFYRAYACSNAVVSVVHLLQRCPLRPVRAALRVYTKRPVTVNTDESEGPGATIGVCGEPASDERPSTSRPRGEHRRTITRSRNAEPTNGVPIEPATGSDRPGLLDRPAREPIHTVTSDLKDLATWLWSNPERQPVLVLGDTLDTYVSPGRHELAAMLSAEAGLESPDLATAAYFIEKRSGHSALAHIAARSLSSRVGRSKTYSELLGLPF
jgi:nucleoside phosphorylase